MSTKIFLVDAFADGPFAGNPAGVCYVQGSHGEQFPLSDDTMQNIAAEMNVSETAFIQPVTAGPHPTDFLLRWFTPTVEVKLCGHGTLSASAIIFKEFFSGAEGGDVLLKFRTLSGELTARKMETEKSLRIVLDFPCNPPKKVFDWPVNGAEEASGKHKKIQELVNTFGGLESNHVASIWHNPTSGKLVVRLKEDVVSRSILENYVVNPTELLSVDQNSLQDSERVKGIILTRRGDGEEFHFLSRYFAPWVGINEDPVTGSAHTVLGPYWKQDYADNSISTFSARQCSKRGGNLQVSVGESGRVKLGGEAYVVMSGTLNL